MKTGSIVRDKHPDIYKAYEIFGKALHDEGGPLSERDGSGNAKRQRSIFRFRKMRLHGKKIQ